MKGFLTLCMSLGLAFSACTEATYDGSDNERSDDLNTPDGGVESLSFEDADKCISDAFACSLLALPAFGGAVGVLESSQVFEECLASASSGSIACENACNDGFADEIGTLSKPSSSCSAVLASLPFYADQSAECIEQLDVCMDRCDELAGLNSDQHEGDEDGMWGLGFSTCWDLGEKGTCDSYARNLEICGGDLVVDSNEECHILCESTDGAWVDDLGDICISECD